MLKSKQLDKAGAALERALRIDPAMQEYGTIWPKFACIRANTSKLNRWRAKSNDLASDNRALQARNWKMIAVARKAAGNTLGADEAGTRGAASL